MRMLLYLLYHIHRLIVYSHYMFSLHHHLAQNMSMTLFHQEQGRVDLQELMFQDYRMLQQNLSLFHYIMSLLHHRMAQDHGLQNMNCLCLQRLSHKSKM